MRKMHDAQTDHMLECLGDSPLEVEQDASC